MGLLVDGKWQTKWYDTKSNQGKFQRQASQYREWISSDPDAKYTPEKNRYHLYVSWACPWAHRTLIFRQLKQLTELIDVSVVSPEMLDDGWTFKPFPGSTPDKLFNCDCLHQVYTRDNSKVTTRVTVPVLWDKHTDSIVNNESADIIRMFNSAFNAITGDEQDFYPAEHRQEIDYINERVYDKVNNGVYRAGFATTQAAYEEAVTELFETLDYLEARLLKQRYLIGDSLTEADWRLFTTLIRFDVVYHGHFKCNIKRIKDYPALSGYMRELYQYKNVASTVNLAHIKHHYYFSHIMINPTQVVAVGPDLQLEKVHGRDSM
ncbi:glutathione S-transferase family protein [Alteromonas sp. ASW11-130]|uniref:glutathione S-transferase family protein n=1 Tax=Alteromonas sp. ASW11-130 TaxID=3015775 RepID=UPI0022423763|nr:glutathione S-transferase family protein [Alteromonas sp. ASW11-130]MCW8092168.1 glutathione S-transferase family protein [Alteromonas sp. ASW11-130]